MTGTEPVAHSHFPYRMSLLVYFLSITAQHGTSLPIPKYAFHRKIYGECRHALLMSTQDAVEKSDTGPADIIAFHRSGKLSNNYWVGS